MVSLCVNSSSLYKQISNVRNYVESMGYFKVFILIYQKNVDGWF